MNYVDKVDRYVKRHQDQAKFAREADVEGHQVAAALDHRKFFASRPGSADWQASCTCGWCPKTYYYGEMEAMAAAGRHLKAVLRAKEKSSEA